MVPEDLIYRNPYYRPEMVGLQLPHDVYVHIAGIDLVRTGEDEFYVLEDNARTPSGVSYMLENREVMMRVFPDLFAEHRIDPVETYPEELLATLKSVAPHSAPSEPTVALLTPGPFNSAYYEHSFLADKLGIELVEGRDLLVVDNVVVMRTTEGPKRVDVLYRRLDDDFLDPLTFRPDSALGVPGLMNAYQAGNITLANAVGTGVADDKAVYSYMPEIVRFYLGEEPILKNVPTWRCREKDACAYVLEHLKELVVKEVAGSGGYGMLIGPRADQATREEFAAQDPAPIPRTTSPSRRWRSPPARPSSRRASRRATSISAPSSSPAPTRSASSPAASPASPSRKGSLVVNSSQGGGTKDTWVLDA